MPPSADATSLSEAQIQSICHRAFGPQAGLLGVEQFRGGTHNLVYRLSLAGRLPAMLRVAPPPDADLGWDERSLMRREHAMRPYFAPVAALMPAPLLVDFTHQVVGRDYMVQTFIEGTRWEDAAGELSNEEAQPLWRQFGEILRQIHSVRGDQFGHPVAGGQFALWSQAVEFQLHQVSERMSRAGLEAEARQLESVLQALSPLREMLDEVAVPSLLHGDLWLFNLLARREADGWRIVGVLDADRAWWGDPLADWTMFVLANAPADEMAPFRASFWAGYGEMPASPGAAFRANVYAAMHIGNAMAWAVREKDEGTLARGRGDLAAVWEKIGKWQLGSGN